MQIISAISACVKEEMMNILVVDDEPLALVDITRVIKKSVPYADVTSADDPFDALALCEEKEIDVAFIDIEMPGMDGLELARRLSALNPRINTIMVTAYKEYAIDAFKQYASGYILKPAMQTDVEESLKHLRHPVSHITDGLYVRCFGGFEVFYNGEIVKFSRRKAKEVFAFLIDRMGTSVTLGEICAALWEVYTDDEKQKNYFYHLYNNLSKTLNKLGCGDVLIRERNLYAVDTDKVQCDYYNLLKNDARAVNRFQGEYMTQYSWAEDRVGYIENRVEKIKKV